MKISLSMDFNDNHRDTESFTSRQNLNCQNFTCKIQYCSSHIKTSVKGSRNVSDYRLRELGSL